MKRKTWVKNWGTWAQTGEKVVPDFDSTFGG